MQIVKNELKAMLPGLALSAFATLILSSCGGGSSGGATTIVLTAQSISFSIASTPEKVDTFLRQDTVGKEFKHIPKVALLAASLLLFS